MIFFATLCKINLNGTPYCVELFAFLFNLEYLDSFESKYGHKISSYLRRYNST